MLLCVVEGGLALWVFRGAPITATTSGGRLRPSRTQEPRAVRMTRLFARHLLIQCQIDLQDVHPRLPQEPEKPSFSRLRNHVLHRLN